MKSRNLIQTGRTQAICLAALLGACGSAQATTANIDNTVSGFNDIDGKCSIEEVFNDLSAGGASDPACPHFDGQSDKIILAAGTYEVESELKVIKSVEIQGAGLEKTILKAGPEVSFVMDCKSTMKSIIVKVHDLNFQGNGLPRVTGLIADGTDSRFTDSVALQKVRVVDFTLSGVKNLGANVGIDHCMISGNSNDDEGGGGIQNWGMTVFGGHMRITRSTIAENTAAQGGGGIYNVGWLHVDNSTISDNVAENDVTGDNSLADGGGILTVAAPSLPPYGRGQSAMGLVHVTMGENFAINHGGGVFVGPGFPPIGDTVENSIFFNNNVLARANDFEGHTGSDLRPGPNLFSTTELTFDLKSADLMNISPKADPLEDNGGFFPTHALQAGSPAIDRAIGSAAASDQRDLARPVDGNGDGVKVSDLGAYEYGANTEVEIMPLILKSSDAYGIISSSSYSNGKATKLSANASGDFVTIGIPVRGPGTYAISARVHKGADRGKFQLAVVDDATGVFVNVGSAKDTYASSSTLSTLSIGTKSFNSPGLKSFRFKVTGRNSSSTGYKLYFDYVKLVKQ